MNSCVIPRSLQNFINKSLWGGLVSLGSASIICSVRQYLTLIIFLSSKSRMWWWQISMCFVQASHLSELISFMHAWLSSNVVIDWWTGRPHIWQVVLALIVVLKLTHTSTDDKATILCFWVIHDIVVLYL